MISNRLKTTVKESRNVYEISHFLTWNIFLKVKLMLKILLKK